jgi:hypothetical protein
MAEQEALMRYARQATAGISSSTARRAARAELYEHALSRYDEAVAAGSSAEEALRVALDRLGDPAEAQKELRNANRTPLTGKTLALFIAVATLVVLGVITALIVYLWSQGSIYFGG